MAQCNCKKTAAKDCPNGECADCCVGCIRHDTREKCEGCDKKIEEDLCEQCERCDECCDCSQCPNCERKNFDRLCDSLQDYCDICDGLDNVAPGIGEVCDSCASGLSIGGSDNSPDEW